MIPNPATSSSSTPGTQTPGSDALAPQASAAGAAPSASQAAAPGPQSSPSAPAAPPTPRQIFWDVARLAFALMTRLIEVLHPIQSYYLEQSRQAMRVCTELCRIMLTIRFAPERITAAQLRHLTRARHILQALFNYPLGARTPPSATPANTSSPSPNSLGARKSSSANTPSPTVPAVPEVPEVPAVPAVPSPNTPAAAFSHTPASPTSDPAHSSHTSHDSHNSQNPQSTIHNPQSSFSPYIPDANTLVTAVRAASLPANCAGALLENPGEALVRALRQLHAVYFSLYPNQSPSPSPSQSQSVQSLQSLQSVQSVHAVHSEFSNPVSPSSQSEISNFKSEIPNPQSAICNPQTGIPHSTAPP